jgi:hypothetical protein
VTDDRAANAGAAGRRGARLKAAAVLGAVFLLGGLTGGAVERVRVARELGRIMDGPPREARTRFRMEALRRHLELRDDQVAPVRAVLDQGEADRDEAMKGCGPGLDELHRRTDARLRELLDDEQKKRLDALEARHRRHWGGPPHGPP